MRYWKITSHAPKQFTRPSTLLSMHDTILKYNFVLRPFQFFWLILKKTSVNHELNILLHYSVNTNLQVEIITWISTARPVNGSFLQTRHQRRLNVLICWWSTMNPADHHHGNKTTLPGAKMKLFKFCKVCIFMWLFCFVSLFSENQWTSKFSMDFKIHNFQKTNIKNLILHFSDILRFCMGVRKISLWTSSHRLRYGELV